MIQPCLHCGEDTKKIGEEFCCHGCATAYKIINKLGFKNYYQLRQIDPKVRKIRPDLQEEIDISEFITHQKDGSYSLSLMVHGLHCAACVWLIENILKKQKDVITARINLSKKTLALSWSGAAQRGSELIHLIHEIGYKLLPFDEEILNATEKKYNDSILRALAIAGFGVGNIMLFSFSLWFANKAEMNGSTRNLLQFFSSLIALPVIVYAARPFFSSAFNSIKRGYPNMDLAISAAIFLACVVSLLETFRSADHTYFDSAVMLIFFLLIGRYLDLLARKKAFTIATEFSLLAASFGHVEENSQVRILPTKQLQQGMILLVALGEKIAADGVVTEGESEVDFSLISGETMPKKIVPGMEVFAGTINMGAPLKVKITKPPHKSLLAEIIRLSEEVENKKNHYVRIADRLARFYLPAVHLLSLNTFLLWFFYFKSGWEIALMNATAVLIITCPCALALAVPIVQTIAISNFIKKGILVKSGEALEKLREVNTIIFDKTGSLTVGSPKLVDIILLTGSGVRTPIALKNEQRNFYLQLAASLSKNSRHPISQAISQSYAGELLEISIVENKGLGLETNFQNHSLKLGRRDFCNIEKNFEFDEKFLTCFLKFGEEEVVFLFEDTPKKDAKIVVEKLKIFGKKIILLSGDREKTVRQTAQNLEIEEFYFEQTPIGKVQLLEKLKLQNKKFIMVGDGLNDAPSLALADVSISFSRAADISQNIADIIIQGENLSPILDLIISTKKTISLMKQNLLIALIYNLIAIPFAIGGYVVPLVAAIAMSSSSLLVLFNSLRMNQSRSQ